VKSKWAAPVGSCADGGVAEDGCADGVSCSAISEAAIRHQRSRQRRSLEPDSVYFPGLNGLRFFAAMIVAVSHVELLKQYHGLPNAYDTPAVYELGRLAVTLFFVLSGYLITFLLLKEKDVTGTIAVGAFYMRRILRIWPLYFLLVALAFFVFPRIGVMQISPLSNTSSTLPMFLLFLPQLALSIFAPVPFAEPAWSIGVEEQFYLLWPLLLRRFRNFVVVAIVVIALILAARYGALAMATANRSDAAALAKWNVVINFFYFTRIECMAIGGLFAWAVFRKRRAILRFLYHPLVQLSTYALIAYVLFTNAHKPIFSYGWSAILFGILIVNVSTNPRSLLKLSWKPFDFLGNISFSIYMFHEVAIQLTLAVLGKQPSNVLLYAISLTLTIALASASYLWFERPFLRRKSRFTIVRSQPALVPSYS
jgi:peptidoglycan/LPS O-acetylase OafA/YrhL